MEERAQTPRVATTAAPGRPLPPQRGDHGKSREESLCRERQRGLGAAVADATGLEGRWRRRQATATLLKRPAQGLQREPGHGWADRSGQQATGDGPEDPGAGVRQRRLTQRRACGVVVGCCNDGGGRCAPTAREGVHGTKGGRASQLECISRCRLPPRACGAAP